MKGTAILLTARHGDLLNAIPIAKDIFDKTGEKPFWIVNGLYQSTLMGCSYIVPDKVHFSIHKVNHALQYAEAKYDKVLNCTAWGKHWRGRRNDHFNFLSWENVGYGEHFDDLKNFPLVFDKRDAQREQFLLDHHVKDRRSLILTCLGCSKSSPFIHAPMLQEIIRRKWGESCQIVDLCGVKAARIYDLLALYEMASVLVTTDTAALHLATAVPNLGVVALLNDNPFLATRPRGKVLFATGYASALPSVQKVHEAIFVGLQQARERRRKETVPSAVAVS